MTSDVSHGLGDVILERYELVRLLGSGGWGRVYLANDQLLHRPVAIKQLLRRLAADPSAVSRFLREATVIASIREPHVVTIHDIAERDGQHYMVMEYADAGTLAQVLQLEGTLSPYEALSVAIDVCQGLRAVHNKGVVHRDVKPANVMFFSRTDAMPVAKVGDFGIALAPQDERLTPADNIVGTLIYLSPEQASSSLVVTRAADLYSLGVMLYEMMSGELQEPLFLNPLFASGDSTEVYQQLGMFPDPVRPLLIKSLKRNPEHRFQDADEMLQALQRARSRLTVSFTTQTVDPAVLEALQRAPTTEPEPEPKRKSMFPARVFAIAVITMVLLIAGGMATFGLVSGSTRSTPEPTSTQVVAANPTATVTPTIVPSATATPPPEPTATPSPSPSPSPSPTRSPSPSPSPTRSPSPTPSPSSSPSSTPSVSAVGGLPTRITGSPGLTMVFRDSINGVEEASGDASAEPITYREGSFLWGEVVTRVGNNTFRVDRDSSDSGDPAQPLPSYLRLNVEYSDALRNAISDEDKGKEDFVPSTGEFWVGHLRCGSAISAASSPYRITVQLLQDGQEIAREQYAIRVLSNPTDCKGESEPGGSPPTER